tara:strand:+ start:2839 stop:5031 length:2193 start_codon:yes stop_codon:yes gene_type:complete
MTDYTKTTNFTAKDSLPSGNANKKINGALFDTEYDALATAVSSKANTASPTLTGTVTAPILSVTTSLSLASGATVTGINDTDAMSDASATTIATSESIKAYVDAQQDTVDTWAEVLALGNSSGATNVVVTSGQVLTTNTISETTAASGVTIDSVLLKDNTVTATTLNGTLGTAAQPNITSLGTIASLDAGAIEFNSLSGTGAVTITDVLDEDNMASDSATALATQQSIKAYVDAQQDTVDTLAEVMALGNSTGGTNLVVTSGDVITTNTINETTAASGVTIDSVLLKDNGVTATTFTGALTGNADTATSAGIVTTAAQGNITSLGTLTALQVDNLNLNGNTVSATTGAVNITPATGSAIVLDGTINVDAGVVTGATSITSTALVGDLTGNADTVTTNANLTGHVTSVGNAAVLGAFTKAQLDTAISDGNAAYSGGAFHDGFSDFVANEHIDWTSTSSALTTTGVITGATVEATGDTSAGDSAAMGYTASEGLILTGQGSTNDVTIKNDADATVMSVATGSLDVNFARQVTSGGAAVTNYNKVTALNIAQFIANQTAATSSQLAEFQGQKNGTVVFQLGKLVSANNNLYLRSNNDDVILAPSNTTNLTLSGASGSETATFAGDVTVTDYLKTPESAELTIASGVVTATASFHSIDTQSDASTDDLVTINGGSEGAILYLIAASSARTVVLKDSTGNLEMAGDFSLTSIRDMITFIYNNGAWVEVSRSNNGT